MSKRLLAALLLVLLQVLPSYGQITQRIRLSEVDRVPLIVSSLRITILKLKDGLVRTGGTMIELQVENLSLATFVPFAPQRFTIVGSDDSQADVLAIMVGDTCLPAGERRIAPGARIKESFALSSRVQLPARVYYNDMYLALIAE